MTQAWNYTSAAPLTGRINFHAQFATKDWFAFVRQNAGATASDHILDIGCGRADFWRSQGPELPKAHLTLADSSDALLAEAKGAVPNATTQRVSLSGLGSLPFPDASFDRIFAMHMLYHVDDADQSLKELERVLRPGGTLIATTNAEDDMKILVSIGRDYFGTSASGSIYPKFGATVAENRLNAQFNTVTRHDHIDDYIGVTAQAVCDYLSTLPEAQGQDTTGLLSLVEDAMTNGAVPVRRHTVLFQAIKAR